MIAIDLETDLIHEYDVVEFASCIECFGTAGYKFASFYNGHGPFCSKKCFASYIGVEYAQLPAMQKKGKIR